MTHPKWSAAHINAVWEHAGPSPRWRYIPRAVGSRGQWEVWDRKQDRFLTDDELFALPLESVRDETFTN